MGAVCCKPEEEEQGDGTFGIGSNRVKTWKRRPWRSDEPITESQLQVRQSAAQGRGGSARQTGAGRAGGERADGHRQPAAPQVLPWLGWAVLVFVVLVFSSQSATYGLAVAASTPATCSACVRSTGKLSPTTGATEVSPVSGQARLGQDGWEQRNRVYAAGHGGSNIILRQTNTQTRKDRIERGQNTTLLFGLKNADQICNKHLLLVDDIITTGATAEWAGRCLLQANPAAIHFAAAAYTLS